MAVIVRIPTPFQHLTAGNEEITASASTVGELLQELEASFPGLQGKISEAGRVRGYINIFVNEHDIRFLQNEETPLQDCDEVIIVPAISGG